MNRTDQQTMKELMNIVLTKVINGYKLPWWVFFVAAINPASEDSQFAVNEMDPAQLDRFLRIKVGANHTEWSEYAIEQRLDPDFILAVDPQLFSYAKTYNEIDLDATPRSLELSSYIYSSKNILNNSGFFTNEEIAKSDIDVGTLIKGKVGLTAGSTILSRLSQANKLIKAEDILTGTSEHITKEIKEKITASPMLSQKLIISNLIYYITNTVGKYYFMSIAKESKEKEKEEAKKKWENIVSQFKETILAVSKSIQVWGSSALLKSSFNIPLYETYYKNKRVQPFHLLANAFGKDVYTQLVELHKTEVSADFTNKN